LAIIEREEKKEESTLKKFKQKLETFIDENWNILDEKEG